MNEFLLKNWLIQCLVDESINGPIEKITGSVFKVRVSYLYRFREIHTQTYSYKTQTQLFLFVNASHIYKIYTFPKITIVRFPNKMT